MVLALVTIYPKRIIADDVLVVLTSFLIVHHRLECAEAISSLLNREKVFADVILRSFILSDFCVLSSCLVFHQAIAVTSL